MAKWMKPVLVKICGITNTEDALWASNFGADFVGLNFFKDSPRKVSIDKAKEIAASLPPFVKPVGVFVNAPVQEIEKVMKAVPLHAVQLHGEENADFIADLRAHLSIKIWKAARLENESSAAALSQFQGLADALLLDAHAEGQNGGTGQTFDWSWVSKAKEAGLPIVLAGGLNPSNIREAIESAEPWGVDVASGVEKDGHPKKKDAEKMKSFIMKAKGMA